MKKIIKILSLFILVITLTGCSKYNLTMYISEKDVNLSLIYGLEHDLVTEKDYFKELKEDLEEIGYKTFDYQDKDYTGIKATVSLGELNNLVTNEDIEVNLIELFKKDFEEIKLFQLNNKVYYANFMLDLTEETLKKEIDVRDVKEDNLNLKFELKLPMKTRSNNATEVSKDGRTLTWLLKYNEKNEIDFTFKLNDNAFLYSIISSIILLTAFIIIVTLKINKLKKDETEERLDHSVTLPNKENHIFGTEEITQDETRKEDSIDNLGIIKKSSSNAFSDLMSQTKEENAKEVKKQIPVVDTSHSKQYDKDDPVFGFLEEEEQEMQEKK